MDFEESNETSNASSEKYDDILHPKILKRLSKVNCSEQSEVHQRIIYENGKWSKLELTKTVDVSKIFTLPNMIDNGKFKIIEDNNSQTTVMMDIPRSIDTKVIVGYCVRYFEK